MLNNEWFASLAEKKETADTHELATRSASRPLLRTVLLMMSSALLGGVAFAIWNRRQISSIREKDTVYPWPPVSDDDDAIY